VVAGVDPPFLVEQVAYPLGPLVELRARQHLRDGPLAVQQGEQDVVGGALRPPPEDLRDELLLQKRGASDD
jgi:hypothetical protein